jgi:hypothetical protein
MVALGAPTAKENTFSEEHSKGLWAQLEKILIKVDAKGAIDKSSSP